MLLELHFAENAFLLQFLLEYPEGLIDIVIANTNLHVADTTSLIWSRTDIQEMADW
jgi:hypothetical protein